MKDKDIFKAMDAIEEEYLNEGLDSWQNQKIEGKGERKNMIKIPFFKTVPVAAAAMIGILAAGSLTTYAAWKFFSAEEVVEIAGDTKLANAFKGEGAIAVNESQSYGDYKVTLLGTTSGKNLSDYMLKCNGELKDNRTYAVVSISKKDGTAMPEKNTYSSIMTEQDEFLVTPFIKGENPADINLFKINGSSTVFTEGAAEYQIVSCDNLEAFAKRGVYLGVLMTQLIDDTVYCLDKETGEITRNEDFDGMNLLFNLPLDKSKGNETAAEKQLAEWNKDAQNNQMEIEVEGSTKKGSTYTYSSTEEDTVIGKTMDGKQKREEEKKWDAKRVKKEAVIIKETVQKVKPDKDGMIEYSWEFDNMGGSGGIEENEVFEDGQLGMSDTVRLSYDAEGKQLYITTFTRNEDGTVTVALYRKK